MDNLRRTGFFLLLSAALIHGAVLAVAVIKSGTIDGFAFQSLDAREYYAVAANLVDHGAFSQSEHPPFRPDTWRTPGYPFFLAACMTVIGKSPTGLILVQQLLGVLNVVLIFQVARKFMPIRRAAIAALLCAVEPYHLYYSLWLMSTTLQTTLLLLVWTVWIHRARSPISIRQAGLLGVFCGLLVLTWPGALFIPIALVLGLFVRATALRRRWFVIPTFLVLLSVTMGGWIGRNRSVGGSWAFSHQSGIVLAYFKATEVTLWHEGRTADRYLETSLDQQHSDVPHRVWERIDRRLQELHSDLPIGQRESLRWSNLAQGNRTEMDSFKLNAQLRWIGLSMLLDSPWATAACCLTRCAEILTFPLDLGIAPPNGVEVNRWKSAAIGSAYAALTLAAVVRVFRRGGRTPELFFPSACTAALLLAATPQTDPRFRVPMIPLLLVVALLPRRSLQCQVIDPLRFEGAITEPIRSEPKVR